MKQIERISYMEQLFDFISTTMQKPSINHEQYEETQKAIAVLSDYYSSNKWKQDYTDDEEGRLPNDLKRGVLSEDGIWNLLSEWHEWKQQHQQ